MLKLLIYAKIGHIVSTKVIEEMTKYHDIYKFVCDRIKPSVRSIQRYCDELGKYCEVLLQITLQTALKKDSSILITLQSIEPSKKHTIPIKI